MTATTPPALRVEEPELPRRVRRPIDIARLALTVLLIGLVVAVAAAARATTTGVDSDLLVIGRRVPQALIGVAALAAAGAGLLLLPGIVVLRLVQRRLWNAGMVTAAVPLALLVTAAVATWLRGPAPEAIAGDFVAPVPGDGVPTLSGFVAALIAAMTTAAPSPRSRRAFALVIVTALGTGLLAGQSSVLSAALSLGLGRLAGLLVRLVAGSATVRPDGRAVAAVLAEHGFRAVSVVAQPAEPMRAFQATSASGVELAVTVIDRDRIGAELVPRLWRVLRTRGEALPRVDVTLEAAAERRTALALAADAAGVRTPRLLFAVAAEPDAALVAYAHVDTTGFGHLGPAAVRDASLEDAWEQLRRLHIAGIAHRSVGPDSFRLDGSGRCWMHDSATGQVAATSFARQLDVAQALVALATIVGAQRCVAAATRVLGADVVARALPLLQPIALPASTRAALRGRKGLLPELRSELLAATGSEPPPPVVLERFTPRTLLTAVGLAVALYLIGSELVGVDFGAVLSQTDWRWLGPALAGVVATYVGSAASLLGFVRDRVPYLRAVGAQLALSFVKLVAPATIGNAAVNIRLLTKAGMADAAAAASVAAGQVAAILVTVPLLLLLGLLTGQAVASGLAPSPTALAVAGLVVALAALLLLVRPVRERLRRLWRGFVDQGLPPLMEAVQTPSKLAQGVGGNLLLTAGYTVALYACVRAVGADIVMPVAAVVFLTGNTVGAAVPTPGGLGAVEAALATGLTAAGVPGGLAVPATLLFRLVSFWLPLAPGYLAWTQMQRRGLL